MGFTQVSFTVHVKIGNMLAYAGIPSTFLFLPHPKAGTVFNLKKNRQGCRLTVMSKLYHSLAVVLS